MLFSGHGEGERNECGRVKETEEVNARVESRFMNLNQGENQLLPVHLYGRTAL